MKNIIYSVGGCFIDMFGHVNWLEHEKHLVTGLKRCRDCQTDKDKRGYFTTTNGMDFYCGGRESENFRCIDLRGVKTDKEARAALERYYSAINASEDKYPGKIL